MEKPKFKPPLPPSRHRDDLPEKAGILIMIGVPILIAITLGLLLGG